MMKLFIALSLFAATLAHAQTTPHADFRVRWVEIPMHDPNGSVRLKAAVLRPELSGALPAVIFSHGSPMTAAERSAMTPLSYLSAAQWFLDRGYVVVLALRRGFGQSDGQFGEGVDAGGADYVGAGRVAAQDIRAVVDFARTTSGIDPARLILVGHSAGGFGSLAAVADRMKVLGVVSFAGGKGSQLLGSGSRYTDAIVAAAAAYGKTARVPSLWIYAENDHWFPPALARRMFDAYRANGAAAELMMLSPLASEGHMLFTPEAQATWTVGLERFLKRIDGK